MPEGTPVKEITPLSSNRMTTRNIAEPTAVRSCIYHNQLLQTIRSPSPTAKTIPSFLERENDTHKHFFVAAIVQFLSSIANTNEPPLPA